jgi:hypothetical protein
MAQGPFSPDPGCVTFDDNLILPPNTLVTIVVSNSSQLSVPLMLDSVQSLSLTGNAPLPSAIDIPLAKLFHKNNFHNSIGGSGTMG